MRSVDVVAPEPDPQSLAKLKPDQVVLHVHTLVLHTPPQPFDEPVVHPSPFAIHAHLGTHRLDCFDVGLADVGFDWVDGLGNVGRVMAA